MHLMFPCLGIPQFIHSSTEGTPGDFKVWAIMRKATINLCAQVFLWTWVFSHLGKHQEALLLDHMVT